MDKAIQTILEAMVLAPSAHNTQPWQFKVNGFAVDVFVDWSRHLAVSDPSQRELHISLGCTIMNGVVAGAKEGMAAEITYFPDGEEEGKPFDSAQGKPVARLVFAPGNPDRRLAHLYSVISSRRTNRFPFHTKPLEQNEREILAGIDTHVLLIENRNTIEQIAAIQEEGTYKSLGRQDFKEELSKWVRNNWTRRHDGMPGYTRGMPGLVSLVSPFMVKKAPIHKQEGPKARKLFSNSPGVIVVAMPGDTKIDWLKAGQLLERAWLEAAAAGLDTDILASAIESSEDERIKVRAILDTTFHPQAILRVGHSTKVNLKSTPRRTVEECLVR